MSVRLQTARAKISANGKNNYIAPASGGQVQDVREEGKQNPTADSSSDARRILVRNDKWLLESWAHTSVQAADGFERLDGYPKYNEST